MKKLRRSARDARTAIYNLGVLAVGVVLVGIVRPWPLRHDEIEWLLGPLELLIAETVVPVVIAIGPLISARTGGKHDEAVQRASRTTRLRTAAS